MGDEPFIGYSKDKLIDILDDLRSDMKEVKQALEVGNFESRLRSLEQFKWKLVGALVAVDAVGAVAMAFIVK